MKRAWRLRALAGRYYAEYSTDDGETWTPTPPGGFKSATAAAQLVIDMKRNDEEGVADLSADDKLALLEKFSDREDELADDMYNADARREERLLEWGKYLVDKGIVNEGSDDDGQLRAGMAS